MKNKYLIKLGYQFDHLKSLSGIQRHFQNPWLIILFRLGVIKLPYFLHRIQKDGQSYAMMARPSATAKADVWVLREVFVQEAYKEVLALLKTKNIRMVDIGANLGSFTIWANRMLGVREAFCFEPEPDSFRLLNFNLSMNDCFTAKTMPCAVGGQARNIKIALNKSCPGATSIYAGNGSSESTMIQVIAFNQWLSEVGGEFDLLKLDCEGSEWEIIAQTDPQAFARFRVVVAEVHLDPENKQKVPEFEMSMRKFGFRTVRWDNTSNGLYIGVRDAAAGR
jgi:FkbM family methyltransferase